LKNELKYIIIIITKRRLALQVYINRFFDFTTVCCLWFIERKITPVYSIFYVDKPEKLNQFAITASDIVINIDAVEGAYVARGCHSRGHVSAFTQLLEEYSSASDPVYEIMKDIADYVDDIDRGKQDPLGLYGIYTALEQICSVANRDQLFTKVLGHMKTILDGMYAVRRKTYLEQVKEAKDADLHGRYVASVIRPSSNKVIEHIFKQHPDVQAVVRQAGNNTGVYSRKEKQFDYSVGAFQQLIAEHGEVDHWHISEEYGDVTHSKKHGDPKGTKIPFQTLVTAIQKHVESQFAIVSDIC